MKTFVLIASISLFIMLIVGCANSKTQGAPTPAYATYYFPIYYPSYTYAPFFDKYYQPGPQNDNFNYYGYYSYWGEQS